MWKVSLIRNKFLVNIPVLATLNFFPIHKTCLSIEAFTLNADICGLFLLCKYVPDTSRNQHFEIYIKLVFHANYLVITLVAFAQSFLNQFIRNISLQTLFDKKVFVLGDISLLSSDWYKNLCRICYF